ncbi:hypothetical protein [Oceanobacillus senegalensis]|uniref:hypothetical protein n=1 Tax=Oceanobacillus senegalensis TaxID=1936063 RepID=UPI001C4E3B4D|nr:hypothetical protein [Oceanobacillus senegalensis]
MLFSKVNGANVHRSDSSYIYGFLSSISHITVEKTMGNGQLCGTRLKRKHQLLAENMSSIMADLLNQVELSGSIGMFHYYSFNREREVAFYYPQLEYDFSPKELDIATELDKNTLRR